jgi:hypothetical protein
MTWKEFLALPKRIRSPNRRLHEEVRELRKQIETTGEETIHESNRCCGKRAYDTKEEALASILSNRSNKSKKPFRAYICPEGKWHLSGFSKKKYRDAKKKRE